MNYPSEINNNDKLLESSSLSLETMPMLSIIIERLATSSTENLRHKSSTPIYFQVKNIASARIDEVLSGYEQNGIAAIFNADEWDNSIVIGLSREFIYTTLEALLGGDGSEPETTTVRSFSSIEMEMTKNILENISRAFEQSFSVVTPIHLKFDRIETRMDFAAIGRKTSMAVNALIEVQAFNRRGLMSVIIPQPVISSIRKDLIKPVTLDAKPRDPAWAKHMQSEVKKLIMPVEAIVENIDLTFDEINNFEIGQVISLSTRDITSVSLHSHERGIFRGNLRIADNRCVIQLADAIVEKEETLDDILSL